MTATTQGALALNSNTPSVFNFGDQSVRLIMIDGEPWFSAADVCAVLNIKNHRDSLMHLDADEKGVVSTDTLGGPQKISIVNESGLYALVLRSRKPEARRFAKWVTGEVLPSIRKTGSYGSPDKIRMAHALAAEVAAMVTRSVFDSVLAGGDDWRDGYWTFHLAYDNEGKQTRPYVKKAEPGAFTVTLPRLTELICAPDWMCRTEDLSALATACVQRLERQAKGQTLRTFRVQAHDN